MLGNPGMAERAVTVGQGRRSRAHDLTRARVDRRRPRRGGRRGLFPRRAAGREGLILEPEGVGRVLARSRHFLGVLIALGAGRAWPVAAGVIAQTVVVHLLIADPLSAPVALGLSDAAEALITAGLIGCCFSAQISASTSYAR